METEKIVEGYLQHIPVEVLEKAKHIKVLITDVDGVLTDGGIFYDNEGMEYKKYNVKDGLIVQHLKNAGFLVGAITGRASQVVENRCNELRFDFHYHGVKDKLKKLTELMETMELSLEEVAYIGDDLIDLPVLIRVGLSIAPADALPYVCAAVHHVSTFKGGKGVYREAADLLLHAKGQLVPLVENLVKKEA
ncbi:MAG: HAD hydrolase family protein [Bacteroidetes bacterium]|nr:HAD hydrolase family protein [Bacteroidota bacterium]MDA1267897.1 HAD hydrolase family protein [Bacteroidota bacterium]